MKPTQFPWKWLLFGLLAVLLSSIAVFPFLIGDTSRFSDLVASELSRWTGGQVKFTGPVRVSFFPDISVRGELEVQDSARLPLVKSMTVKEAKISLDLVDLLRGDVTIDSLRLSGRDHLVDRRDDRPHCGSTHTPLRMTDVAGLISGSGDKPTAGGVELSHPLRRSSDADRPHHSEEETCQCDEYEAEDIGGGVRVQHEQGDQQEVDPEPEPGERDASPVPGSSFLSSQ
jgi:hypothetical protein